MMLYENECIILQPYVFILNWTYLTYYKMEIDDHLKWGKYK